MSHPAPRDTHYNSFPGFLRRLEGRQEEASAHAHRDRVLRGFQRDLRIAAELIVVAVLTLGIVMGVASLVLKDMPAWWLPIGVTCAVVAVLKRAVRHLHSDHRH